jgi:hypothetical protein
VFHLYILPFPAVYPVLSTVPEAVVVLSWVQHNQFLCAFHLCCTGWYLFIENREVNLLNLIGVLRKKFFNVFHPHHNSLLPKKGFEHKGKHI